MWQQNSYQETPMLTFISTPESLGEKITLSDLSFPYVLLRFRPSCACGKEFRSCGKDKAQKQIEKHLGYKKYTNCKPTVEELHYETPEFVTLEQVYWTNANQARNNKIRAKVSQVDVIFEDVKYNIEDQRLYGLYFKDDGTIWNMRTGEQEIIMYPTKRDGYQIEKNINIKVQIVAKSKPRRVKNDTLEVCEVTLQDENGDKIKMTVWNGECQRLQEGQHLVIRNAYVKDAWNGGRELATYKNSSSIEVVEN